MAALVVQEGLAPKDDHCRQGRAGVATHSVTSKALSGMIAGALIGAKLACFLRGALLARFLRSASEKLQV